MASDEEDEGEEILGSDDDEQEAPSDYKQGGCRARDPARLGSAGRGAVGRGPVPMFAVVWSAQSPWSFSEIVSCVSRVLHVEKLIQLIIDFCCHAYRS